MIRGHTVGGMEILSFAINIFFAPQYCAGSANGIAF